MEQCNNVALGFCKSASDPHGNGRKTSQRHLCRLPAPGLFPRGSPERSVELSGLFACLRFPPGLFDAVCNHDMQAARDASPVLPGLKGP